MAGKPKSECLTAAQVEEIIRLYRTLPRGPSGAILKGGTQRGALHDIAARLRIPYWTLVDVIKRARRRGVDVSGQSAAVRPKRGQQRFRRQRTGLVRKSLQESKR